MEPNDKLGSNIDAFFSQLRLKSSPNFDIQSPPWNLPTSLDSTSSGVYVCTLAVGFAEGFENLSFKTTFEMRETILMTICGSCTVQGKRDRLVCFKCGTKGSNSMVSCNKCGQWSHYSCFNTPSDASFSKKSFICGDLQCKTNL